MFAGIDPAQVVALLVGTVLPLLTGLVTKAEVGKHVRAVVLLVLAGVTSVLTELGASLSTGTSFELGTVVLAALGTFLVGVGVHFGLWKPTGASNKAKARGVK